MTALDVLGEYLSDSAVSVLSQTFIEIEEPLTTFIGFAYAYRLPCNLSIQFESVPVEHLDKLEQKLFDVFRKVAENGIDMERMATVIEKRRNGYLLSVERSPSGILSTKLIVEALYGDLKGTSLKQDVTDLVYYDIVTKWTSDQWVALLQRYISVRSNDDNRWWIDNPHVSILGKPSSQLAKNLEKNEIARIKAQRKRLGEEGLKKMKRKLEQAQEENDKPIPKDLIRKFKVPKIENIKFIDTINAVYQRRSSPSHRERNEIERYLDTDPSDYPINLVFSHTSTQFVTVALYITTKDIPGELLPYLQVYLDSFFSLPIVRDGKVVDYEDVVSEVNRIAVNYSARLGAEEVTEVVSLKLRAEKSRYKEVVRLLRELFIHSVLDPER
jgi:Zn-dependent M16 (insulinase) family peptidase